MSRRLDLIVIYHTPTGWSWTRYGDRPSIGGFLPSKRAAHADVRDRNPDRDWTYAPGSEAME